MSLRRNLPDQSKYESLRIQSYIQDILKEKAPEKLSHISLFVDTDPDCQCQMKNWFHRYRCSGCDFLKGLVNLKQKIDYSQKHTLEFRRSSYDINSFPIKSNNVKMENKVVNIDPFYNLMINRHLVNRDQYYYQYHFACGNRGYHVSYCRDPYSETIEIPKFMGKFLNTLRNLHSDHEYIFHTIDLDNIKIEETSGDFMVNILSTGHDSYTLGGYRFRALCDCYTPKTSMEIQDGKYVISSKEEMKRFLNVRKYGFSLKPSFDTYLFLLNLYKTNDNKDLIVYMNKAFGEDWNEIRERLKNVGVGVEESLIGIVLRDDIDTVLLS